MPDQPPVEIRTCPYCAEAVQPEAVACPHCQRNIGPGHELQRIGQQLSSLGCVLTLLLTVPILVLMLLAGAC